MLCQSETSFDVEDLLGLTDVGYNQLLVHNGNSNYSRNLANEANTAADAAGDLAAAVRPGRIRPNSAGSMIADGHPPISAQSVRGGAEPDLTPAVRQALDDIPVELRGNGHGRCWEPQVISEMQRRGINPKGALSSARLVRSSVDHPLHNKPIEACESCKILLDRFGIVDLHAGQ